MGGLRTKGNEVTSYVDRNNQDITDKVSFEFCDKKNLNSYDAQTT